MILSFLCFIFLAHLRANFLILRCRLVHVDIVVASFIYFHPLIGLPGRDRTASYPGLESGAPPFMRLGVLNFGAPRRIRTGRTVWWAI